ncbi:MAG: fumarylacetoacetate hydrolase family protein [Rikenellaceae bacterium]
MKLISIINNFEPLNIEGELASKPLFTTLPDTVMLRNNDPLYIPPFCKRLEAGCQVIIKISRVVKHIEQRFASRCYDEIGLAVVFSDGEMHEWLIKNSLSLDMAQSFDKSTAISPKFLDVNQLTTPLEALRFELKVNSELKQSAVIGDMRFSIDEIISYVSRFVTLKIGDMILCGAPSSLIGVQAGDVFTASLNGMESLNFELR